MAKYEVQATITINYYVSVEVSAKDEETASTKAEVLFEEWTPDDTKSSIECGDQDSSVTIDRVEELA